MGNIILYTGYKKRYIGEERAANMYKELVDKLQKEPATNYGINEAESLAARVLEISNYEMGATPIVRIANNIGFATLKEKNMSEDISGNIFVGGTTKDVYGVEKVIVVDAEEEYAHQRFIIAHELGHYLMDYLGSDDSKNTGILFSRAYPKSNHNSAEEIRADRFAAELLMPTKLFRRLYLRAMDASDCNLRYTISYLAKYFKTKRSSVERRIDEVIN